MELTAALISAVVSLSIGALSFFASRWQVDRQLQQSQMASILAKRIETYPKLWSIHIRYETNWAFDGKPKDRAWAEKYLAELREFNDEHGLFFSQKLYEKFGELRGYLMQAIVNTKAGEVVDPTLTSKIRLSVYGENKEKPGLSTFLKDDLGSYRGTALQIRIE